MSSDRADVYELLLLSTYFNICHITIDTFCQNKNIFTSFLGNLMYRRQTLDRKSKSEGGHISPNNKNLTLLTH